MMSQTGLHKTWAAQIDKKLWCYSENIYAEQHDLTVCHLCNSKSVIRLKSGTNVIIESQDLIQ